ncbi:dihydroorotate dehydrogenase electron transfer subunit, partial [Candidatus Woesearchaeota archaeon]|nr:dihydroorotate dehydrogenase electron transfer subunit [Candidatus Woesearchaeota archaeon]
CTDDGCVGFKGFTSDLLEQFLKKKKYKIVYTCGPEIMIKKVFDICEKHKINCEASLERFMKCGFGVCGNCAIDDQMVCKDGPVFDSVKLRKLTELGKFARLMSGKKVPLKEYYAWRSK